MTRNTKKETVEKCRKEDPRNKEKKVDVVDPDKKMPNNDPDKKMPNKMKAKDSLESKGKKVNFVSRNKVMTGKKKKTPNENVAASETTTYKKKNTNNSTPIKRTIMTRSEKRKESEVRKESINVLTKEKVLLALKKFPEKPADENDIASHTNAKSTAANDAKKSKTIRMFFRKVPGREG